MLIAVPLPAANVPVHDPQTGLMTLPWRKFYEYQTALADQQAAMTQAAAQQAAAAQTQANTASTQASMAQSASGGSTPQAQTMSASGASALSGPTWRPGAMVTFPSAIAASSVSVGDSGPTTATGKTTNASVSGQARLVRTVGGADTVVAGPVDYMWAYDSDALRSSMSFDGFPNLGADATTGSVSYRVDVNGTPSAQVQSTISITRNP